MTDDRPHQPEDFPPGAGPAGAAAAEPPPLTAFAWRNGLVRPTHGRLLAGVSGALARSTNTDPVLWRVIIAVLTIFGGLGVLLYVLGWLLLPADGDTASPVEALLGRGRSATSSTLTVIVGVVALISAGAFVSEPFQPGIVGAILLGAAALLLLRDQRGRSRGVMPTAPMASAAGTAEPGQTTPSGEQPMTHTASGAGAPNAEAPAGAPVPPQPPYSQAPYPPPHGASPYGASQQTAHQYGSHQYGHQPFAPRGPFAQRGLPPQPPRPTQPPIPPAPKPPRSGLGSLTFSLLLIVVGALIAIDLTYRSIPPVGYVTAALAVVALGLIIGAWFGRARGLIALGIVLSIALTSLAGLSRFNGNFRTGTVTFAPTAMSQLQREYSQDFGEIMLDLTKLDFAAESEPVNIDVRVQGGNVQILLPRNVDVTVKTHINVGEARVLGHIRSGVGLGTQTVTDLGPDGEGGGTLLINAQVNLGDLEVSR